MVVGNQASRTNSRTIIKNIHKYPLYSIPLHPSDLTYICTLSSPLVCYPWRNRNHRCKLRTYNIESFSPHSLIPLQDWPRMIEFIRVWRSSYNTHTHTQQTWSCKFEEMKCWSWGNNKKTCHDFGRKPKCRNKITSNKKKPWRRIYICASKLNKNTSKNPFQIYTIPFHLYETNDRSITQSLWIWW